MMETLLRRRLLLLLLFFFFFVVVLFVHRSDAQPTTTGYTCTANQTDYPCRTYAFYRASPNSNYTDLASIGDLFGTSRLMIADPSNISTSALSAPLAVDQPLLVPLTCSCNPHNGTNISYANTTYTIKAGDTFLRLSTGPFENLTSYQSVELVNPDLVATNLTIGVDVVFPIFCKCPNETQSGGGVNFLVSYVLQPSDNLSSVASRFGIQEQSIVDINGQNTKPTDTLFLPLSKLPNLTQPTVSPSASAPSAKKERTGLIVGLAIGVGVLGAFLILVIALWLHRERSNKKRGPGPASLEGDAEKRKAYGEKRSSEMEVNLMADVSDCLDKYRVFGIDELKEATDGFSSRCLIQGSVYKGCLNGEVFAIKKMKWNAYEELKILQKVNHGNLVRLEGFCIDSEDANCYLIYEFVPSGSLHSWLHEAGHQGRLNWKTRLRIAFDVANGLQYIHEHTQPRVVHKDVKSSNILLDSNMRAKIANFGLAKSGCNAITMHIVGTQGYIAPEYLSDGVVSTRMDVFSFGVVLLELVSGREVMDEEGRVMWAAAIEAFGGRSSEEIGKAERLRGWMDDGLAVDSSCSVQSVANVVSVAISCLNRDPAKRPSMVDVVYALCKSDDIFDISQDGFSTEAQVSAR